MQTARRYRFVGVALGVVLAGFVALSACSNNAEGERCEINNGNDDCQDGLVCVPASSVNEGYRASARCCPPQDRRATATHPACTTPTGTFDAGQPVTEGGPPPDASTGDADAEASTPIVEAGADADADAPDGD